MNLHKTPRIQHVSPYMTKENWKSTTIVLQLKTEVKCPEHKELSHSSKNTHTHTHLPKEKGNIKETKERKLRLNKFCQVSQPSGRPKKLGK